MSEQDTQSLLSEAQKSKMICDIHHALVGDPLDPKKPGLVALVGKHDETLYGKDGKNGLRSEAFTFRKVIWMGGGFLAAGQFAMILFEVWKSINGK